MKSACSVVFFPSFLFHSNNSLSPSLKSELQFLSVSEMGQVHTLALNLKNWPYGTTVTKYFRSKLGHLNESVWCKLTDRTLKMLFIERSSFLWPTIPELRKLLFFRLKKYLYKKNLKTFSSKQQKFTQSPENIKKYSSK